jgi:ribosomal protein S18 acetylase RimI-like enzyme
MIEIRSFSPGDDEDAVIALWQECGLTRPHNDPRRDIRRKLLVQGELFLVGVSEATLVATVMAGYDGHRGWLNYLAVHPSCRRRGLGRQLVEAAEARLRTLGCAKINLQVRDDNMQAVAFYHRIGFLPDRVVCLGKRLVVDHQQDTSTP